MIAFKKNPFLSNMLVRAKISHHNDISLTSGPSTRGSTQPAKSQIKPIMESDFHYTGKKPPTFKELNAFPFKLFKKTKSVKPCCRKQCNTCKRLNHSSNFVKSKVTGRCFPILTNGNAMTCQSSRVVYLIQCRQCTKQYVGQTTKPLHIRLNQHLHNIRGPKPSKNKLWWHFNKDHKIEDLQIIPLQQVDGLLPLPIAESELQKLETLWIKKLASMQPKGMNFVLEDTEKRT